MQTEPRSFQKLQTPKDMRRKRNLTTQPSPYRKIRTGEKSPVSQKTASPSRKSKIGHQQADSSSTLQIQDQIKVYIRMRPILPPAETDIQWAVSADRTTITSLLNNASGRDAVEITMKSNQLVFNPTLRDRELKRRFQDIQTPQVFKFETCFNQNVDSPEIYHEVVRPIVKQALQGYNGSIFMYGQTTSGKTYSMLGQQRSPGILPCAVRDVFKGIEAESDQFKIHVSYLEIYNESINDLFNKDAQNLKLTNDPNHGVSVIGLQKQEVQTFDQAMALLQYGEENRVYKETHVHDHSSRSHTIFRVFIEKEISKFEAAYSTLNLVDLAGSERLSEIERKEDIHQETANINKSLFVLSHVISKLAEGKSSHIPYRDSKLTRILQNAIGGNSLTAILCTISPASINFFQTLSTLRFASRAQIVQNQVSLNRYQVKSEEVVQLEQTIERLLSDAEYQQQECLKHQNQIRQLIAQNEQLVLEVGDKQDQIPILMKEIEDLKDENKTLRDRHDSQAFHQDDYYTESPQKLQQELTKAKMTIKSLQQKIEELQTDQRVETAYFQSNERMQEGVQGVSSRNNIPLNESPQQFYLTVGKSIPKSQFKQYNMNLKNSTRPENRAQEKNDSTASFRRPADSFGPIPEQPNNSVREPHRQTSGDLQNMGSTDSYSVANFNRENTDSAFNTGRTNNGQILENQGERRSHQMVIDSDEEPLDSEQVMVTDDQAEKVKVEYFAPELAKRAPENEPPLQFQMIDEAEEYSSFDQQSGNLLPRLTLDAVAEGFDQSEQLSLFVWGSGKDGRCGNKSEEGFQVPTEVVVQDEKQQVVKFQQLSCGYHHSAAVSTKGRVYIWGRGIFGQLGHNDTDNRFVPTLVSGLPEKHPILQVACGWQHTLCLTASGVMFSWGYGEEGQLGHGNTEDSYEPRKLDYFTNKGLKVAFVSAGHSHSGAITEAPYDGATTQLYLWGSNQDNRLMQEDTENRLYPCTTILEQVKLQLAKQDRNELAWNVEPIQISLGFSHSAVVTRSGELFTCGAKAEGQLGMRNGNFEPSKDFEEESEADKLSQGVPIARIEEFGADNQAVKVSCGDNFTLVLVQTGKVYAFGKGSHGRLGLGASRQLRLDDNISGQSSLQLDDSSLVPSQDQPCLITGDIQHTTTIDIATGCRHAACISETGQLYCWGFNFYEQLGLGDSDKDFDEPTRCFIKSKTQAQVSNVSCGYFHTAALVKH